MFRRPESHVGNTQGHIGNPAFLKRTEIDTCCSRSDSLPFRVKQNHVHGLPGRLIRRIVEDESHIQASAFQIL